MIGAIHGDNNKYKIVNYLKSFLYLHKPLCIRNIQYIKWSHWNSLGQNVWIDRDDKVLSLRDCILTYSHRMPVQRNFSRRSNHLDCTYVPWAVREGMGVC